MALCNWFPLLTRMYQHCLVSSRRPLLTYNPFNPLRNWILFATCLRFNLPKYKPKICILLFRWGTLCYLTQHTAGASHYLVTILRRGVKETNFQIYQITNISYSRQFSSDVRNYFLNFIETLLRWFLYITGIYQLQVEETVQSWWSSNKQGAGDQSSNETWHVPKHDG